MTAVWRAARAAVRRRKLQTFVIGVVVAFSAAMVVLALGLISAASGPFDQAFAHQRGAHLTAAFDTAKVPESQIAQTAHAPGVEAAAGPFGQAVVKASFHTSAGDDPQILPRSVAIVGRADRGGPVDHLDLQEGRWPEKPGEVVFYHDASGFGVAPSFVDKITIDGGPTLTIVGFATSMTHSADAWVAPEQMAALHPTSEQMLYRLHKASTPADVDAGRSAVQAALPPGSLLASQSYLTLKDAVASEPGVFVPFLLVFGVLGIIVAVIIVGNVVSGAVISGFRHIGILKSIGFTPGQVMAVYLVMATLPALIGTVFGTVAGNFIAEPLIAKVFKGFFGAGIGLPSWVDVVAVIGMPLIVVVAAYIPSARARRLSATEAISAGSRAHTGRSLRVQRWLAGSGLPRAVSLGLGMPFSRPGRSMLTLSAVVLGVMSLTFALGLATSVTTYQDAENRADAYQVQIFANPNSQNSGGAKLSDQADEALLHAAPGAAHVAAYATVHAPIAGTSEEVNIQFYRGDIPDNGYRVLAGHWPDQNGQVAVSSKFLIRRGMSVGDHVTLELGGHRVVTQIVGSLLLNGADSMFSDWENLPQFAAGTRADSYEIQLKPGTDPKAYMAAVTAKDPGLADYSVNSVDSFQLIVDSVVGLLTFMLSTVAALGVFNTVVLNARERRRDLGMLKSIGMTPRQVTSMMVTSMAFLGAIGGLLGVPFGVLLHRLVMPAMAGAGQIVTPSFMLQVYHPPLLIGMALAGVFIAAAGSLLPSWMAARTTIAEVLQTE